MFKLTLNNYEALSSNFKINWMRKLKLSFMIAKLNFVNQVNL